MVFLAIVRAMSTICIPWLGSVTDEKCPNKWSDGGSGIGQSNVRDSLSVISLQLCCKGGQCQIAWMCDVCYVVSCTV